MLTRPKPCAFAATLLTILFGLADVMPAQTETGTTLVPPLRGQTLTNQVELLARLRATPKLIASEARAFKTLRYRLFKPAGFDSEKSYPLVLSLHGGGPRHSFDHLLEGETPGFAYGIGRLVGLETQRKHPCFVLVPWSGPQGWNPGNCDLAIGILDELRKEFKIDPKRIYVTGQSMGGFGTWSMITRHPEIFAAAIPVCGGGEPAHATKAKGIPVWTFHGNSDGIVPVSETRNMVEALTKAGGQVIYWEYDKATHAQTAERAYCEPVLIDWLFRQSKH